MHGIPEQAAWAASTCNRYRTSLLQIGRTLKELFDERNEDILDAAAWEIGLAEITEFVSLRKDAGVSLATINRDLTAFNHLMTHIKNKGWIEVNPVQLFEKQGMREKLPPIVLPAEEAIARLAERAPGTLTYFPGFLNETGGRITEMAMTKWSDVSGMERPVEGNVTLTLQNTKGGKVRTIRLRQQAIDILLQIPQSNRSPYVFWNKTEDGYYRSAANLFWDYAQEVDFGARMHDLRHKFAIERLKDGWSVYRVQRYIGHGSVKTTERYYFRYLSQEQQEIANADGNVGL
ncbi:tyrosine-type recombinase/integrase [Roseovarius sp. D0-M9]|uniref:tyrosine-type recombinase/integrase n=1 Tax=Roseovarius sp. D0-M9 TaxID=3127117 RepID=UPI00300FF544